VLRKVIRSAVDAASAGDHVIVDFIIASSSRLEIKGRLSLGTDFHRRSRLCRLGLSDAGGT
jgi:hypothetical protein